ncbi:hypothetical protein K435DRAFT_799113 [Dendrothele bispora CBS 962.96]|uniref:Uncharacterized protein n=1 Tax=Dendrothele bispora (strain CBS 962.96) TaxID=1314807 RepID=A0A4S8LWW9_DENBC|nr:hypothetical protein K435DRAFT_799113 [Dendrothele bispora CBS 962.96]
MRLPSVFKLASLSLITTSTTVTSLPVLGEADIASRPGVPSSSSLRVTSPDDSRRRTPDSSATESSKSAEGINSSTISIIFPTSGLDSEQDMLGTKDSSTNEEEDSEARQPKRAISFGRRLSVA